MQISNAHDIPVVLPLHPRTSKILKKNLSAKIQNLIKTNENIHILPPVSYLDMIALERSAAMIMTDSGGVQKEAYFFKKFCVPTR